MTYQRNISIGLEVEEHVADEALEEPVGGVEVGAHDGDGDHDHDGRRGELLAARPLDLLQLSDGLAGERPEAAAALALRPGLALGLAGRLDPLAPLAGALCGTGRL